jgi:hypothetical protein
VVNFRGIVDHHADRSVKSARQLGGRLGRPEPTPQRRAENVLLVKVLDRVFGLLLVAVGAAIMWQAWQGTLVDGSSS